jgi:hypothetical protein
VPSPKRVRPDRIRPRAISADPESSASPNLSVSDTPRRAEERGHRDDLARHLEKLLCGDNSGPFEAKAGDRSLGYGGAVHLKAQRARR